MKVVFSNQRGSTEVPFDTQGALSVELARQWLKGKGFSDAFIGDYTEEGAKALRAAIPQQAQNPVIVQMREYATGGAFTVSITN